MSYRKSSIIGYISQAASIGHAAFLRHVTCFKLSLSKLCHTHSVISSHHAFCNVRPRLTRNIYLLVHDNKQLTTPLTRLDL